MMAATAAAGMTSGGPAACWAELPGKIAAARSAVQRGRAEQAARGYTTEAIKGLEALLRMQAAAAAGQHAQAG